MNKFFKFIRSIIPKTEYDKIMDEIDLLETNKSDCGKVSMLYYRLSNMHALLMGKEHDKNEDKANFFFAKEYYKLYKYYRELYIEFKLSINENKKYTVYKNHYSGSTLHSFKKYIKWNEGIINCPIIPNLPTYSIPIYENGIETEYTIDGIVGDDKYIKLIKLTPEGKLPVIINLNVKDSTNE